MQGLPRQHKGIRRLFQQNFDVHFHAGFGTCKICQYGDLQGGGMGARVHGRVQARHRRTGSRTIGQCQPGRQAGVYQRHVRLGYRHNRLEVVVGHQLQQGLAQGGQLPGLQVYRLHSTGERSMNHRVADTCSGNGASGTVFFQGGLQHLYLACRLVTAAFGHRALCQQLLVALQLFPPVAQLRPDTPFRRLQSFEFLVQLYGVQAHQQIFRGHRCTFSVRHLQHLGRDLGRDPGRDQRPAPRLQDSGIAAGQGEGTRLHLQGLHRQGRLWQHRERLQPLPHPYHRCRDHGGQQQEQDHPCQPAPTPDL